MFDANKTGSGGNGPDSASAVDRRRFMSSALSAGASAALAAGAAGAQQPSGEGQLGAGIEKRYTAPPAGVGPRLFREEQEIRHCEVEGKLPEDLKGAFFRVGPDPQFALHPGNIPFDGEGHVSQFLFENGAVHYKSRYVRNERWVAQDKAGKILFPMYRNPYMDDPSVKGKSRGTHNTHIIDHNGMLLAFKEDSPPAALDLYTLETLDPVYDFKGQLKSKTFTAHPKLDSHTGNLLAFGYEAKGFDTADVNVFEYTPKGKKVWDAWVKVPYVGMLHDFAVTENFVVFYVIPMKIDKAQMEKGGIHWSWWPGEPTYFGYLRRGGDGSDVVWIKGPERSATHLMGAFDDGKRVFVDVESSLSNPFPFMPYHDGSRWDPVRGGSIITQLSANLTEKTPKDYQIDVMFPDMLLPLPRQDDRYNTAHYRWGFGSVDLQEGGARKSGIARLDMQNRTRDFWQAPQGASLGEICHAPRNDKAPEGAGYVMAVATYAAEGNRSDLVILDAEHVADGPVATVKLPTRIVGQVHGYFVPESRMGGKRAGRKNA